MAIEHRFDETWGIVVTTFVGEVSAEDLTAHARALVADPQARGCDELADLTHVTGASATTEAVRAMGTWLKETDTNRPGGKFAMVAPSDVAFGMARLYQAHRDHPEIEIRVFREYAEALEWLGIKETGLYS